MSIKRLQDKELKHITAGAGRGITLAEFVDLMRTSDDRAKIAHAYAGNFSLDEKPGGRPVAS